MMLHSPGRRFTSPLIHVLAGAACVLALYGGLVPVACCMQAQATPAHGPDDRQDVAPRLQARARRDLFATKTWVPPLPPQVPPKPVAPPLPFVFLGTMRNAANTGDGMQLFLAQGERSFIVRKGDTVDNQYRLDAITGDIAIFTYLPLQEQQRLSIGNNR